MSQSQLDTKEDKGEAAVEDEVEVAVERIINENKKNLITGNETEDDNILITFYFKLHALLIAKCFNAIKNIRGLKKFKTKTLDDMYRYFLLDSNVDRFKTKTLDDMYRYFLVDSNNVDRVIDFVNKVLTKRKFSRTNVETFNKLEDYFKKLEDYNNKNIFPQIPQPQISQHGGALGFIVNTPPPTPLTFGNTRLTAPYPIMSLILAIALYYYHKNQESIDNKITDITNDIQTIIKKREPRELEQDGSSRKNAKRRKSMRKRRSLNRRKRRLTKSRRKTKTKYV